jgi:hypothetical protein
VGRQILAVALGVVVSFLAAAGGGYFLYQLSDSLGHQAPLLARYILNPVIALLVGVCVGALAKSSAGVLAALSLTPWALGFLFAQRQDASHSLVLALLSLLYLLIGMVVATGTFRMRTRNAASGLIRT